MKKTFLFTGLMFVLTSGFVFSQSPLEFTNSVQKFGKVDEGTEVKLTYDFSNKGTKPVIINESKVNCSCTHVTYPKAPVAPGKGDKIDVVFHTSGKIGYQERTVDLITDQGTSRIVFKGVVKATDQTKQEYKANQ